MMNFSGSRNDCNVHLNEGDRHPQDTSVDIQYSWTKKRPERTSTPIPQPVKTSLCAQQLSHSGNSPESLQHSQAIKVTQIDLPDNKIKGTDIMETPRRNMNMRDCVGSNNLHISVESDAEEDSCDFKENPLDLICSPVKKVKPRNSMCVLKRPERTSTPIPQPVKTSLCAQQLTHSGNSPESLQHSQAIKVTQIDLPDNKIKGTDIMETPRRNMNMRDCVGSNNLHISVESDAEEDSCDFKENPLDLICSPVKKVKPRNSMCVLKRPERTSTPIPQPVKTSLCAQQLTHSGNSPESLQHSQAIKVTQIDLPDNKIKGTDIMETPRRNMNMRDCVGSNNLHISVESDAEEDSCDFKENPLDLICSPVKKVKPRNSMCVLKQKYCTEDVNIQEDQKLPNVYDRDDKNLLKIVDEKPPVRSESTKEILAACKVSELGRGDSENTNSLRKSDRSSAQKFPTQQNICEGNVALNTEPLSKNVDGDKLEVVALKNVFSAAKNQSADSGQYPSDMETPFKISRLSRLFRKRQVPPGSYSVPLFNRIPSCKNMDSNQDSPDTLNTVSSVSSDAKSILNKLSLPKKKRSSGKFMYPTKPEEGYETLQMKYIESIGLTESNKSSVTELEPSPAKIHTASTESASSSFVTDIHTIAKRQCNFLSLTNLEKDLRFESGYMQKQIVNSHLDKENRTTPPPGYHEVPVKLNGRHQVESQQKDSRSPPIALLAVNSAVSTGPVIKSDLLFDGGVSVRIKEDKKLATTHTNLPNITTCESHKTLNFVQGYSKMVVSGCEHQMPSKVLSADMIQNREERQKNEEPEMVICEARVVPQKEESVLTVSQCPDKKEQHGVLKEEETSEIMNDSLNDIDFSEIEENFSVPVKDEGLTERNNDFIKRSSQGCNTAGLEVDDGSRNSNGGRAEKAYSHNTNFCGFLTGNGKPTKVSKEALNYGKRLLDEITFDDESHTTDDQKNCGHDTHKKIKSNKMNHESLASSSSLTNSRGMYGFNTCSGFRVKVNPVAVERVQKLREESEREGSEVKGADHSKHLSHVLRQKNLGIVPDDGGSKSLNTSKGAHVKINESSLSGTDGTHDNENHVDNKTESVNTNNRQLSCLKTSSTTVRGFQGFSLASGLRVNTSQQALKRSRLLWREFYEDEAKQVNTNTDKNSETGKSLQSSLKSQGFDKACLGVPAPRSEQQVIQWSEEAVSVFGGNSKIANCRASPVFQAGRGTNMKISQSALMRAKALKNRTEDLGSSGESIHAAQKMSQKSIGRNIEPIVKNGNCSSEKMEQHTALCIRRKDMNLIETGSSVDQSEQLKGESFRRVSMRVAASVRAKKLWQERNSVSAVPEKTSRLNLNSGNKSLFKSEQPFPEQVMENPIDFVSTKGSMGTVLSPREEVKLTEGRSDVRRSSLMSDTVVQNNNGLLCSTDLTRRSQESEEPSLEGRGFITEKRNIMALVQDSSIERRDSDQEIGESKEVKTNNELSKRERSMMTAENRLNACVRGSVTPGLLDNKPRPACNIDTLKVSKDFVEEKGCSTESIGPSISGEMEVSMPVGGSKAAVEEPLSKPITPEEDSLRSPSPILGSQKINWKYIKSDGSVHKYTIVDIGAPAQQEFRVVKPEYDHSEENREHSIIKPDSITRSSPEAKRYRIIRDHVLDTERSNTDLKYQILTGRSQPNPVTKIHYSPVIRPHSQLILREIGDCSKTDALRDRGKDTLTLDTQEITEITEAFLKDDPWEQEEAEEDQVTGRKRSQDSVHETIVGQPKRQRTAAPVDHTLVPRGSTNLQVNEAVEAEREMLRKTQAKLIQHKEKHLVHPIPGSLYKMRSENKKKRIKLSSLGTLKMFRRKSEVTSKNAVQYRFEVDDKRCGSVNCEDGFCVVPGADNCIGVKEMEQGFLAMPGVHPGLVPSGWVTNHYRWIVWKLAAQERRLLNCQALTLGNVVDRLKYRYDREIDDAVRPILRKITEHDDIPQKTMILCVADITTNQQDASVPATERSQSRCKQTCILELTDGWYSLGGVVDNAMAELIHDGKVEIGTKLVIHGAELSGPLMACHPLQAPATLCLRLHTNMTRRARWWSRLGLAPHRGPLPTLIGATLGNGGLVGQMTAMLARVYPLVYFERSNGRAVFRGEKAHLRILKETQQKKEAAVHQIMADVERELSQEARESSEGGRPMTREEILSLTLGSDIARLMENTADPYSLQGILTPHQVELARLWRQQQADERRKNINAEVQRRLAKSHVLYEPTPLLKVRIVDNYGAGAMVTIWRPSEDLRLALTEGSHFSIRYLLAAGFRNECLQFTAVRQTRWEPVMEGPPASSPEFDRCVTPLCLLSSGELNPLWKEVDVAGVVLRVGLLNKGLQLVHIVDHHINILTLKFWGGLKEYGVENIVAIGSVICVLNGNWRGHAGGRFGSIHVTELTFITSSPRSAHLLEAVAHLKNSIKDMKSFLYEGDMKLDGQFDSRAFLAEPTSAAKCLQGNIGDQELVHHESTDISKQAERDGTTDQKPLCAVNGEDTINPKMKRLQQRSQEIRSKLKVLGQYRTPSSLRRLHSPPTVGARKLFQAPFKQPQIFDGKGDKCE
ncbi:uncharacterized protein LOC121855480 [Homarus americanus]|uniref:uncharacterized protein LOC121855480 n=1 Tax=Homarus americanus TaxID=6706 RepID=UPI001C4673AB|nr:uncharacterized protein LOC121855480 [Homarus americanus]